MDFPNKKKDLTYSSYEEFQKNCNFDFSKLDFNKATICNSLLKLYDEGYKSLTFGDDEKAYMLLFRFFEGYVKLRSSKLYKNDKAYVESLISQEKLKKSVNLLEKLKAEIKQRYEDRLTQTKNEIHTIETKSHKIEVEIETINLSNYLNPTELVNLLRQGNLKILIIDIRDESEFSNSRMNLDILMTQNIKLKNLISYINIPGDLIKPTTWEINEELIKKNPNSARIFSERNNFDHLILFDTSSVFKSLKQDSKILILKRAVYEYDFERVKNEPVILDGGWSSWLIYYPAYKTSNKNKEINEKSSIKNVINIEYPEVPPTPTEPIPPTEPVINTQPEAPVEMPNKIEDIVNQVLIKPLIDRSNKPAVKEIATVNSPIINRLQKPIETDNKNNPVTLKDFLPVNTLNHVDKPQFNKIETLPVNDVIFNSVYAPTRFKVIHTPFMKDGNHKVLNLETGLYQEKNEPHRESNSKPTIKQEIKEPVKPISNLKRTFSSPNIANLENLVLNDESKNEIRNEPVKTIPSINRSNKPMSDNVILSRIEELDPVYANIYPGITGIRNLGNTCFMNSIIQCISNTELLVKFFLSGQFTKDLNRKNILGFKGEIADEFSVIVKSIWSGHCKIISPKRFKYLIGEFNQQFISNEQQDAQEFLLFLLDGLHEDLNRVKNRPKISNKESENEKLSDIDAANLAWNLHLSLNNSIIVDLFQVSLVVFLLVSILGKYCVNTEMCLTSTQKSDKHANKN
ncbi:unnamed protein product [Brachionus calyciflorus]|uniref:ubiquitinyl hydrolase 1 n=1 Tax=Brachionus calyciflorus TaxID=104777 RepID=A0A813Z194_9BILA|nr:unnamed protein product [Brachionus calyciflorus]